MSKRTPFGKVRKVNNPYAVYKAGDFTWKILKTYQHPDREVDNRYARWYVAASSPMTYFNDEYGDTYVREILEYGTLVTATPEWKEHYEKEKV